MSTPPTIPLDTLYSKETLNGIVGFCRSRGIWVISDEVYLEIAPEGFVSVSSLSIAEDIAVILSSVSKFHRMTGWRCSWVVAPKTMVENLVLLNMCMSYGLPPFIQDATLAAIETDYEIPSLVKVKLDRNRELFCDELSKMTEAKLYAKDGDMFAVIDLCPLGMGSEDFS